MSEQNGPITAMTRREFIKVLGAAGTTVAFVSACAPASLGQAPASAPPAAAQPVAPVAPVQSAATQAGDVFASAGKDLVLRTYTRMVRSRKWETSLKDMRMSAQKDPMYGSWYPYVGEEAVSNGVCAALNDDDWICISHRSQGGVVAKGVDLQKDADEIFFRTTGTNKGYGGTMHIADKSKGVVASGIVGGAWFEACGLAYSHVVNKTKGVAVGFGGDGAANSGYFFNAVRNAVNYKVPVLFVIENNQYQGSNSYRKTSPVENLADYVKGLPLPAVVVDGNDVAAVYAAAKAAVDRARAGNGPTVIEAKTYRWYDHRNFAGAKVGVDGAFGLEYRPDDEVRAWIAKDPIKRLEAFLIERKFATQADLDKINKDEQANCDTAIANAQKAPTPKPEMGLQNLWVGVTLPATQFFNGKGLASGV